MISPLSARFTLKSSADGQGFAKRHGVVRFSASRQRLLPAPISRFAWASCRFLPRAAFRARRRYFPCESRRPTGARGGDMAAAASARRRGRTQVRLEAGVDARRAEIIADELSAMRDA